MTVQALCDRCGALIMLPQKSKTFTKTFTTKKVEYCWQLAGELDGAYMARVDLCPACSRAFEAFMDGGKHGSIGNPEEPIPDGRT